MSDTTNSNLEKLPNWQERLLAANQQTNPIPPVQEWFKNKEKETVWEKLAKLAGTQESYPKPNSNIKPKFDVTGFNDARSGFYDYSNLGNEQFKDFEAIEDSEIKARNFIKRARKTMQIEFVEPNELPDRAAGRFDSETQRIYIRKGLSTIKQAYAIAHEMQHFLDYKNGKMKETTVEAELRADSLGRRIFKNYESGYDMDPDKVIEGYREVNEGIRYK